MPISDEMRGLVEDAGVSRFDLGKLAGAGVYVPSETYDATVAARDALITAIEKLEAERDHWRERANEPVSLVERSHWEAFKQDMQAENYALKKERDEYKKYAPAYVSAACGGQGTACSEQQVDDYLDLRLGRLVRRMPELERTNVDEIKLTWRRYGSLWKVRDGEDKIIARADTPEAALQAALKEVEG